MPANNALREKRRQLGLCLPCGESAVPNETRCARCKKLHQEAARRMVVRKAESSVCLDCSEPALPNHRRCAVHRARAAEYQMKSPRKLKHLFGQGVCMNCGKPALSTVKHRRFAVCETCFLKQLARRHLGSQSRWHELHQKLAEQNFRCPYTGEFLELGRNASIDHILPSSKYPERRTDITNVEWVTRTANAAKGEMTKEAFLAWVALVHEFSGHGASRDKPCPRADYLSAPGCL